MKLPLWRLRTWRRKLWEAVGSSRYSIACPQSILRGLHKYLQSPGFFIEAGAVDGFFESNTYYLERFESWKGILIEPVPEMYARLRTNRPKAIHYHCALVASNYPHRSVTISPAHAMSTIVLSGRETGATRPLMDVPARTLGSIVEEVRPSRIDLLSLDVEGFEIEVLRGLDLRVHRPRYMLIECLTGQAKDSMDQFLRGTYRCIDQFTHRDYLYAPCDRD